MTPSRFERAEESARRLIARSERRWTGRRGGRASVSRKEKTGSFLWDHSRQVAALARRLALAEGANEQEAYLAGLFHDAGKFAARSLRRGRAPEEKASAAAAAAVLKKEGFSRAATARVADALASLYHASAKKNVLTDIVHDADFLTKFGRLGVAQFFIKATLRGLTLSRMVAESLSRELTYAAVLGRNMRTASGRKLAAARRAETERYFRGLLRELEEVHGCRYRIRTFLFKPGGADSRRGPVPLRLVHPFSCGRCGGSFRPSFALEKGVKCEMLETELRCAGCAESYRFSFCLPEFGG